MRLITDILRDIRNGKVVNAASSQMAELVLAVADTGKAGSLTIKLTVKPDKEGENMLTIEPVIDVKMPRHDLSGGVFFFDAEGNLTRTDPKQTEMALSRVADRPSPGVTGDVLAQVGQ